MRTPSSESPIMTWLEGQIRSHQVRSGQMSTGFQVDRSGHVGLDPGTQTKRASIRSRILPIASAKKGVPFQVSFSFQSDLQVFLVKPHIL